MRTIYNVLLFFFTEPFLARSSAKSFDGYVWWFGLFSEKEWKRISVAYLPRQLLGSEEWAETVLKKGAAERTLLSRSVVSDSVTPWTVAHPAPLSIGFPRQGDGVGCHFLLQGILPTQESNLHFLPLLHLHVDSFPLEALAFCKYN